MEASQRQPEKLYLTQPTISTHIRSLEEELHTRLIIRTTKKLTITPKGYQLYDSAVRMLDIRNNLFENFTGSKKQIIDLAASTIPSSYLLPELMAGFGRMYPDVYFHSWQTDSAGAISRVLDGSVDLALTGQNTGDDSCIFIPFCQDDMVIATPVNDHYLQLQEQRCHSLPIFWTRSLYHARKRFRYQKGAGPSTWRRQGIEPVSSLNVVARMNDLEAVRRSIVQGIGISVSLPTALPRDLADSRQRLLFPLDKVSSVRTFYIVYNKNRILKSHVKQFIHFTEGFYQNPETP